ncbi:uncharacterized protein V1510DRAFT_163449 [Dipodascopsis tothii]|uniref:uncharacterized protein n=1 Tax=Dipodascopsis tothii TaxID=44089 RepID=UPI0034CEA68C
MPVTSRSTAATYRTVPKVSCITHHTSGSLSGHASNTSRSTMFYLCIARPAGRLTRQHGFHRLGSRRPPYPAPVLRRPRTAVWPPLADSHAHRRETLPPIHNAFITGVSRFFDFFHLSFPVIFSFGYQSLHQLFLTFDFLEACVPFFQLFSACLPAEITLLSCCYQPHHLAVCVQLPDLPTQRCLPLEFYISYPAELLGSPRASR